MNGSFISKLKILNKRNINILSVFRKKFSSSKDALNIDLLKDVNNQILNFLSRLRNGQIKVVDFKSPDELKSIIDFGIKEEGIKTNKDFTDLTDKIIDYSVHPNHSHFFNTLFGGIDEYSLSGEILTAALNGTMYSYEMAPVFSLMEEAVFNKIGSLVNFPQNEGIMCPGGSIANLYGLLLARHHKFPDVKAEGIRNVPQMVILTSELGHYSIEKAAILLGIGLNNICKVKTDKKGRIIPSDLEEKILKIKSEGKEPLAVNATIGSTVFGAIDPLKEISEICRRHQVWMHTDACFGGPLIFLDEYKEKLQGIEFSDSLVLDPHKVLTVPMQCSIFLTRHKTLLKKCNSTNADYLFMKDKITYDAKSLDSGDGSIQCGRHIDILKFWLYLRGRGFSKIKNDVRNALKVAQYLAERINKHRNFELILDPEYLSVCFHYFPDRFISRERGDAFWEDLNKIPPLIKDRMVKDGSMMIAYQKQMKIKNFFRPIVCVDKTKDDMDFIIEEIHRIGKGL